MSFRPYSEGDTAGSEQRSIEVDNEAIMASSAVLSALSLIVKRLDLLNARFEETFNTKINGRDV